MTKREKILLIVLGILLLWCNEREQAQRLLNAEIEINLLRQQVNLHEESIKVLFAPYKELSEKLRRVEE